jgi:hypothetical protein
MTEKIPAPRVAKPRTYAATLEAIRKKRDAIAKAKEAMDKATAVRDILIAHAATFPEAATGVIAQSGGVKPQRVSQIAPVRAARAATREAQKAGVLGSRTEPAPATEKMTPAAAAIAAKLEKVTGRKAALPGAAEYAAELDMAVKRGPRELPGIGETPVTIEHGAASRRKWTPQRGRETAVAHPDGRLVVRGQEMRLPVRGRSAGAWLAALPPTVERLVFVGDPVWHTDDETTMTADVRAWLTAPLPDGWSHGRHYAHERYPVGRFEWRGEGARRAVEIQHMGSWVPGTTVDDPRAGWHAFRLLRDALRSRWGTDGVELLGSPTTLGQDLWARTIPQNTEYPLMSAELRELIRTTSGQGRFELFTPPAIPEKLPALHYYDCTFAYAGLTWGLAVGNPTRVTAREYEAAAPALREKWLRGRGRWHMRVMVPDDWRHVGLLPCSGAGGWEYPSEPGRTFTSWASGPEAWLALTRGWHIEVLDGITWTEGKPLNLWRDKLVDAWSALGTMATTAGPGYADAARLAQKMARSVLLFTIGGFHSRGTQRAGVAASEDSIPATATRAEERDGVWTWQAAREVTGPYAHPEWSAEVYGRMRARLLSGPAGTGALAVRPDQVVAFRSDAMMLTTNTGWSNPGATPGRFRIKGSLSGPLDAPGTEGALLALRDAAEGQE